MSLRAADPRLGTRVGGVVLALLGFAVVWVLLLQDRLTRPATVTVRVFFAHVSSLQEGAPVMVAGRQVGRVDSISLVLRGGADAAHPLAQPGGAVARLAIAASRRALVPVDGDYFVTSRGPLAERFLEVGPPPGGGPPGRPVQDGDAVRGIDPPSMDRLLENMWNNLTTARVFLAAVAPEGRALFAAVEALAATLDQVLPEPARLAALRDDARRAARQAEAAWETLGQAGARPGDLQALLARGATAMAQVRLATTTVRQRLDEVAARLTAARARIAAAQPALAGKLEAALATARTAAARLERVQATVDGLLAVVERGEGTLGRLRNDPEFPEDAKELGRILKRTPWRIFGYPQHDAP